MDGQLLRGGIKGKGILAKSRPNAYTLTDKGDSPNLSGHP